MNHLVLLLLSRADIYTYVHVHVVLNVNKEMVDMQMKRAQLAPYTQYKRTHTLPYSQVYTYV